MIESKIKQLDILLNNYLELGSAMYGGEAVTQLEHALQCAQLSMAADDSDALVAASLLHDVGHLWAHLSTKAIQMIITRKLRCNILKTCLVQK